MIHVCFGLHDKTGHYSKLTGTAMLSIFENLSAPPQSTCIHILHDNTLTTDNRDRFIYLAGRYNQLVKFYNVEQLCATELKEMIELIPQAKTSRLSVAALYRLLIPKILPSDIEKVIYLDSDIIVNLDISELWSLDLGDKIFAAVPELPNTIEVKHRLCVHGLVKIEDYFNSGVLLMNVKRFLEEDIAIIDGIKFIGNHSEYPFLDQEVLNYIFSCRYLKLSTRFNRIIRWCRRQNEMHIKRKIYHFTGDTIQLDLNDEFNRLWMEYFTKTPWFNSEAMGRLMGQIYDNARRTHVAFKNAMTTIADAVSGKTRVFLILEDYLDLVTKTFTLRDNEEIIFIEHGAPLQKIADLMKTSRDKKIFFVMFPSFPFDAFIEAGFVYGRDFLNGFEFLPNTDGDLLESHKLIQAM